MGFQVFYMGFIDLDADVRVEHGLQTLIGTIIRKDGKIEHLNNVTSVIFNIFHKTYTNNLSTARHSKTSGELSSTSQKKRS